MEVQQDFKDLFALFNSHKVEYLIVGGYALGFHGAPRFTGDIDILVKPDLVNAKNILQALDAFGFGSLDLEIKDFSTPRNVIQLGVPPVRIDILTSISGVSWEQAASNRVSGAYGEISVYYISINDFKNNKLAVGRAKDIADLEALNEAKSAGSDERQ